MTLLKSLWRVLKGTLLVLAALVVFIEEFGWRPLAAEADRGGTGSWARRLSQRRTKLNRSVLNIQEVCA